MKTSRFWLACCTALPLLLAGCETTPTKQEQGVVIGAIVGGILGRQVGGDSGRTLATIVDWAGKLRRAVRSLQQRCWPAWCSGLPRWGWPRF